MSFNVALTGLNAANQDLSVTANNLANVGTVGFKGSRRLVDAVPLSGLYIAQTWERPLPIPSCCRVRCIF